MRQEDQSPVYRNDYFRVNVLYQNIFVDSIKALDFDICLSLTQFGESNVKTFIKKKKIKNYYNNISKKKLPKGKKYSNKIMLDFALKQYTKNKRLY